MGVNYGAMLKKLPKIIRVWHEMGLQKSGTFFGALKTVYSER